MKKIYLIAIGFFFLTLQGGCQEPDHEFKVPIYVVKIVFPDGSEMSSAVTNTALTWETLPGKPLTFSPASHTHTVAEITDMTSIELQAAISSLSVIVIPKLTTAQITTLTPTAGSLVYDTSLNVLKIGNGAIWKILITNQ